MTNQEINIKIAKFCKYKEIQPTEIEYMWRVGAVTTGTATWRNPNGDNILEDWLPKYTESLDSIHSALMSQDEDFQEKFQSSLNIVCFKAGRLGCQLDAAHHCKAFLITAGL